MPATPFALRPVCEDGDDCVHCLKRSAAKNDNLVDFSEEKTVPDRVIVLDGEFEGAAPEREVSDDNTMTGCVFCGELYRVGTTHVCRC